MDVDFTQAAASRRFSQMRSFRSQSHMSASRKYSGIGEMQSTTGVESTNFCWVFEFRSANLSVKSDPHFFNARSKRDLLSF
jgi:hypothetical protein